MRHPSSSPWPQCVATLSLALVVLASCGGGGEKPPTGGPDGGGVPDGGSPDGGPGPGPSGCLNGPFLTSLQRNHLLVGAQMEDSTAASAPFDVHYLYIAGGLFDSNDACNSCRSNCTSSGTTCAQGGCAWWGCWQDVSQAPGDYVRGFSSRATGRGQLPFITYYQHLLGSGVGEGQQQVGALNNLGFMRRYLADWRFTLKQVGTTRALLHIEPDLWGYLQFFSNGDPRSVPAQVATANSTDCGAFENNAAGMARCMVAMARKYAPNAKVGLHASPWATKQDVYLNENTSFDVEGEARKVADFLLALGAADTDFVVVEASDRDAGYYDSIGEATWWDANNTSLPNFRQAFTWARALSERMQKPNFWWQLPVGNMSLPNTNQRWRDNRVDYFFAHADEVAAAHAVGFSFGAGEGQQTSPETDNGNLVRRVRLYDETGGQGVCTP
ncbi:hypothetical protein LZ198_25680 [Myxococcus sp. K15C18031901]|uniref:hypothetical protein n=1 Tax=Myxococcus dinghuensis TaxID=2906761 RepID=UPI0020A7A621|nr:hypothetical protein [Myxococcus dinghuensis]MCP3102265.1 hypothetical protein [Myxococcus dinghuensis]